MRVLGEKCALGRYWTTLFVALLIPSLAFPKESQFEECRAAFSSLVGEIYRTRGLRLFIRDVKDGDPITVRDGFFGVPAKGSDEKPWYVPSRLLPLYQSLPGKVVRNTVKLPAHFMSLLDGTYHLTVNKPLGWASEKAGFKRKRTTWLTEGLLFGLASAAAALALDEEKEKKLNRELAENGELIDQLIASDFRMEGIRLLLAQGKISQADARKMAYLLLEEYKQFYDRQDKSQPAQSKVDWEFIKKVGVLPHEIELESLPKDTQSKLADINHLLFVEYRIIAEVEGVSADGKLLVPSNLQSPNVRQVLDHIQGPDETFSKSLIQLYQSGHNGKTIDLSTLKRFLMYDAWVRAIDYGETVVGRDSAETALHLREAGIEDLRGYLKDGRNLPARK